MENLRLTVSRGALLTDIQWATDIVAKSRVAVKKTWERAALSIATTNSTYWPPFVVLKLRYHLAGTTG